MCRSATQLAVVMVRGVFLLLLLAWASASTAEAQFGGNFTFGYTSPAGGLTVYNSGYGALPYSVYRWGPGWGGYYLAFGGYGGFYPGGGYYGGYPYGGYPYGGYTVAPIFVPAETMYGPGAVKRFMGVDPPLATAFPTVSAPLVVPQPALPAAPVVAQPPANPQPLPVPRPVPANEQLRNHALELIQQGDAQFRQHKYHIALQRYKDATANVSDLVDGHMRQGWALLAMGQYEPAARAMKRALQLRKDWPTSRFNLPALYGEPVAPAAHRDALDKAAREHPADPDLAFLAGVFAWAAQEPQVARTWLTTAKGFEVGDTPHIDAFIAVLPPAE